MIAGLGVIAKRSHGGTPGLATPAAAVPRDDIATNGTKLVIEDVNMSQLPLSSRFLNLPLDIRYLVYDTIVQSTCIRLERCPDDRLRRPRSTLFPFALLQVGPRSSVTGWMSLLLTCRQTYLECLQLIYGRSTFFFTNLRTLRSFLWTTPRAHLTFVRRIEVAMQHIVDFSLPYNFYCEKIGRPDEWTDLFTRLGQMRHLDRFDLWMQDERKTLCAIESRPWQNSQQSNQEFSNFGGDAASPEEVEKWEAALESRHHQFWQALVASNVPVYAHVNWDAKGEEGEKVLVRVMTKQQMYEAYWSNSAGRV